MTEAQKAGKFLALGLAVLLIAGIFSGAMMGILSLGLIDGSSSGSIESVDENGYLTETFNQDVENLKIEVLTTGINIVEGKSLSVKYDKSEVKVKNKKNTLTIEELGQAALTKENSTITLTIPKGYSFDKASIETGAGKMTINYLFCESLEVELGAGEMIANKITATEKTNIACGVGTVTIGESNLKNADIECGVGDFSLGATLAGNGNIECGVGKTTVDLHGEEADYTVSVSTGLGIIKVGGKIARDGNTFGNGENTVNIDGGVGKVVVTYN